MSKLFYLFVFIGLSGVLMAQNVDEIKIQFAKENYQEVIKVCDSLLVINIKDLTVWQYKAMAEKALYRYERAEKSYQIALNLYPESLVLKYALGRVQELGGDAEAAKKTYQSVLAIDSLHMNAMSHLASIYRSEQRYIKAMDLYTQLVALDSMNSYFYSQLAYCCLKSQVVWPGINYYIKAIELNPKDYRSKSNLVRNLVFLKYYEDANYWIDTFLVEYPNDMEFLKQQAYLQAVGGNYLDAVRLYRNLVELGDSSLATCKYYGQSLYNNKEYDKAAVWLSKYVEEKPDDAANHLILGLAYQQDYQYEKSLEHFDATESLKYDPILLARIYREKAHTYIKYGDYVGYRDSTQARKQEFYQLAIDHFLKSESMNPDYVGVYKDLGDFYMRKAKNPQLALYYFQKYYDTVDSSKLKDWELVNIQEYIAKLKEEVHFIGE